MLQLVMLVSTCTCMCVLTGHASTDLWGEEELQSFMLCPLTLTPIPMLHNSTVGNKIPSSLSLPFIARLFLNTEDNFLMTFNHAVYNISLTEQVLIWTFQGLTEIAFGICMFHALITEWLDWLKFTDGGLDTWAEVSRLIDLGPGTHPSPTI